MLCHHHLTVVALDRLPQQHRQNIRAFIFISSSCWASYSNAVSLFRWELFEAWVTDPAIRNKVLPPMKCPPCCAVVAASWSTADSRSSLRISQARNFSASFKLATLDCPLPVAWIASRVAVHRISAERTTKVCRVMPTMAKIVACSFTNSLLSCVTEGEMT